MIVDELIALLGYKVDGEAELRRFNQGIEQASHRLSQFAAAAGAFAALAGVAVAAGLGALGKGVITTSAQFEKLEATLTTIEGSSEKAKSSLDWVAEFAAKTPFDLAQVSEAFVRLRAYGMDPMNGLLEDLGNASSGMGKDLMSAVEMISDAATGEFERLKEFGIRASQEGKKVTFSWTENGKTLSKTVNKTSAEITKFIQERFGARFGGAMIRQSKTWDGMMSNLGDSWTGFQRRIGDAGFFEAVRSQLGNVLDAVNRWDGDGTIDKLAGSLSRAMTWAANGIGMAIGQIVRHLTFLSDNFERFSPYLKTFGVALGVLAVWAFPLISVFGAIALVVDDFLTYLEGGESVIGRFAESLSQLTGIDQGTVVGILTALAIGGLGLAAAVGPIRLISGAITGLARALGLMGSAKVAQGVAAVGAAGAAQTGAAGATAAGAAGATATGGMSIISRLIGAALYGMAAYEGAKTITDPSKELQNAPRSKTGVDDALRWLYNQMSSGDAPANDNASYVIPAQGSSERIALDDARRAREAGLGPSPGKVADDLNSGLAVVAARLEQALGNATGNAAKMDGSAAAAAVTNTINDTSDRSINVNVGGVQVNGVAAASGAVGGAVGRAVGQGAASGAQANLPPTRIVGNTGAF